MLCMQKGWYIAMINLCVCFFSDDTFIQATESLQYGMKATCPQTCLAQLSMCFLTKKKPTNQNPAPKPDYTKRSASSRRRKTFEDPNVEDVLNIHWLKLGNSTDHNSQINKWAEWFPPGIKCSFHIHCFKVFCCSSKAFQKTNLGYTF